MFSSNTTSMSPTSAYSCLSTIVYVNSTSLSSFWGATKHHTRECCDFTLDREIGVGQEKVKVVTIRRWYHRMMRWLDAYETGAGAAMVAQKQVQAFSRV